MTWRDGFCPKRRRAVATKDEILEVLSATLGGTANRTQLEKAAAAVAALDGDWQDVTG